MSMKTLIAAALLTLSLAAATCPEDGSGAYATGASRTSSAGYLLYEYKCFQYGHAFWARP